MAREHARLLVRINADRDFAELTPTEQWLFQRLTARQELNYAGVLPLDTKRWARMSKHVTVEEVEKAVATLRSERYLVVDDETDEVLIRSLVRNDEVAKQPNVLKSALRAAEFVESEAIRAELAVELLRVRPAAKEWQQTAIDRTLATLDPSRNPSANPSTNPPTPPVGNPSANPVEERSDDPSLHPSVVVEVEGEVEGESLPQGGLGGGSRTRRPAREAPPRQASGGPPPPDAPLITTYPVQPCGRAHDPDQACRRCGEVRRDSQAAERDADAERTAADRAADQRRRACPMCDADGWLHEIGRALPVSPYARCDHVTDHRQQVADAKDEPA